MLNPIAKRFAAIYRNGIWQVFDRQYFGAADVRFLKKDAEARAEQLNARHAATKRR